MEFTINNRSSNSRRSSFWKYLPGFPRKPKEKPTSTDDDITLVSANKLYSSFRSLTSKKTSKIQKNATSKYSESCHDISRDAASTFLTTDNQLRWRYHDEGKEKHVQFAPTPLNKYHTYSGRCKGKENMSPSHLMGPPILKIPKNLNQNNFNDSTNTMHSVPRTSTKSALARCTNETIPYFDISAVNNDESKSCQELYVTTSQNSRIDRDIGIPFVPRPKSKPQEFKVPNDPLSAVPKKASHGNKPMEFLKGSEIIKLYQPHLPFRDSMAFKSSTNSFEHFYENKHDYKINDHISNSKMHILNPNDKSCRASMPSLHSGSRSKSATLNNVQLMPSGCNTRMHTNAYSQRECNNASLFKQPNKKSTPRSLFLNRSSSFHSKTRSCSLHRKSSYDGASSVADDECSLNCSCCFDDNEDKINERTQFSKRGSKKKLFFPECRAVSSSASMAIPEEGFSTKPEWYDCNDSMCKSPFIDHSIQSKVNNIDEPIYANNDVLIAEDYTITTGETQNSPNRVNTNRDDDQDTTLTDSFCDMTPKTKKLSESCVSALQETLSNLFGHSESKPSVTIAGFNNSIADRPNTIIIQIQKSICESSENNSNSLKEHEANVQNRVLCRSHSLPELPACRIKSPVGVPENSTVESQEAIPVPETTSTEPLDVVSASETGSTMLGSDEDTDSDQEYLDMTPSVASNSGYSTISSSVSIDQIDNSTIGERKFKNKKSPTIKKTLVCTSPRKHKFKAKDVLSGKAKLKLNIYRNYGMITVHVIKAVKLSSVRTVSLNPYVKVTLFPDDSRRCHWRTSLVHDEKNPVFSQMFSFEIVPKDSKRRLIFSVWHRDKDRKRSEFLGCMSFGLHHVIESNQRLTGWYRLLKEVVGTKKHFAAGRQTSLPKILGR